MCILSSFFRVMEEKGEEGVFKFCVVRQECTQQSVVSKFGLLSAAHNHHNLIPTHTKLRLGDMQTIFDKSNFPTDFILRRIRSNIFL